MASNITTYGDISPRTAQYAAKRLLKRAIPYLVLEKFGQSRPIPKKHSDTVKFRRYERFPITPTPLTEGVTPSARKLTTTDIPAQLHQYGDRIEITDVILDTHEDPVMQEGMDILGEQAAQMLEVVRFYAVRGGTNVWYAGGVANRDAVNSAIDLPFQRNIMRQLKRQDARKITRVLRSTPSFNTENVAPAFIAMCHPDVENDLRDMPGWTSPENYGSLSPYENEIGKCEDIRYLTSTIFEPWEDAGGAGDTLLSTGGSKADVYPILYVAADSYGIVPLKGKGAVTPMVVNPKPSDSDPLAQRGHIGWKSWQTAVILNDAWMIRGEVAVTK